MTLPHQKKIIKSSSSATVNELKQSLDYQKVHLKDRIDVVEKMLNQSDFYEDYFSTLFKSNITSQDPLSEEVNVCRSLSRMADYILSSKEVKDEKDAKKNNYVFYTDNQYFRRKMEREVNFSELGGSTSFNNEEDLIHLLKCSEKNYKAEKVQKIVSEDLERTDFLGQILKDYKQLNDYLSNELKSKSNNYNRYLLSRMKGQTARDMIYCKDTLSGVFAYNPKNVSESTKPDYDVFDFTDKDHLLGKSIAAEESRPALKVKGLLYFEPQPLSNGDFALVLHDLNETIKKAGLTNREKFVLSKVRDGASNTSIADSLEINKMEITRVIQRIAKKVIKVGNKYDKRNGSDKESHLESN
ncbi:MULTISPECIES: hypothetical protein [Exiguobacterium]|uniref:hypothetical protein n=1 Tax=Exiguobacterium TaxID=33986 RepID=UPI001BEA6681|nr:MULTISPECIES: hypothetical protein [Exiguobacterium]MCT4776358.1 hypothetical protein [Exiguobacterium aquaticum]MCT4789238.1 hypothetical protein [Exiguobacterium mexicanum]